MPEAHTPSGPILDEGEGRPVGAALIVLLSGAITGYFFWFYFHGDYQIFRGYPGNEYFIPKERGPLDPARLPAYLGGGALAAGLLWLLLSVSRARRRGEGLALAAAATRMPFLPPLLLLLVSIYQVTDRLPTLLPLFLLILVCGASCGLAAWVLAVPQPDDVSSEPARARWWRDRWAIAVYALVVAYAATFSSLSILRLRALNLGFHDSGAFAQALAQSLRGRWMCTPAYEGCTILADHTFVIMFLLAPLYALLPRHETLLILNSVCLAGGAIPIYLLARHRGGGGLVAAGFALAYLLHPGVQLANLPNSYGFHPVAIAVPFLLFSFYFLEREAPRRFLLFALLSLACKQTAAPVVFWAGLYLAAGKRLRVAGVATMLVSAGWLLLTTRVLIPSFRGGPCHFEYYYRSYGSSLPAVLLHVVTHPAEVLKGLLGYGQIVFLLHLCVPFMLLSLFSPLRLAIAGTSLLFLLISDVPLKHSIIFINHATVLPVVAYAAVCGALNLVALASKQARRRGREPAQGTWLRCLACSTVAAAGLSGLLLVVRMFPAETFRVTERDRHVPELKKLIPTEAEIWTTYRLGSHFTSYRYLWVLPLHYGGAQYVVFDLRDRWVHFPRLLELHQQILQDHRYDLIHNQDDYQVFRRQPRTADLRQGMVLDELPIDQMGRRVGQNFPEGLRLSGYRMTARRGSVVQIDLFWTPSRPMEHDYAVVKNIKICRDGKRTEIQHVHLPCDARHPTTLWEPGKHIRDSVLVASPVPLDGAQLRLEVGLRRR